MIKTESKVNRYNNKRRDTLIIFLSFIFLVILSFIANNEQFTIYENRFFRIFNNLKIELGVPFLVFMLLGTLPGVLIFTLIALFFKKIKLAKLIIINSATVLIFTQGLKALIRHPRPENLYEELILRDETPFDFGFPSGHTTLSVSLVVIFLPFIKKRYSFLIYLYALFISIEDFIKAYNLARNLGFKNINIDLIFGIPGQTLKDWKNTLLKVISLKPDHISCYSLELDNNSFFGKELKKGKLKVLDEKVDRQMYHYAIKLLKYNNYNHYEISNFSLKNKECLQNLNFWQGKEYLGFGASAHSFLNQQSFNNIFSIQKYLGSLEKNILPIENLEKYSTKQLLLKNILLNLRLVKGINIENFNKSYNANLLKNYKAKIALLKKLKLIKFSNANLSLTHKGLDLQNQVYQILFS